MQTKMVFCGNSRFLSSHAGSICELPDGDLLAVWYSGEKESSPDSVILCSRLKTGEQEWLPPQVLVNVDHHAAGNPRVFIGPDHAVWLISPINYGRWCDGGTRMFYKKSYDGGQSWTDLEILPAKRRILGKNKPLHINDSPIWIMPVEYEHIGTVAFLRSADNGKHWKVVDVPNGNVYLDQPTVVLLANGELLAYTRSWEGYIYATRSADLGLTWSTPVPTQLLNPHSGIDMVYTRAKKLVLAFNPVALGAQGNLTVRHSTDGVSEPQQISEDLKQASDHDWHQLNAKEKPGPVECIDGYPDWGPRTPLVVGVSEDDGNHWRIQMVLESGPGEYSYPAIIEGADQRIHILYTFNRTGMKYVCLEPKDLS